MLLVPMLLPYTATQSVGKSGGAGGRREGGKGRTGISVSGKEAANEGQTYVALCDRQKPNG